jgi:predicted ATP-binding protein involved in virulence
MAAIPLRLDSIELSNYRCFPFLHMDFHARLTVILARNGCGKTAVLDALAVALGPFLAAFDAARGVNFAHSDVRLQRRPGLAMAEMEALYPLTMTLTGIVNDREETWQRKLSSAKGRTSSATAGTLNRFGKTLQDQVRAAADGRGPSPTLPLLSYYGTGRLWSEMRQKSVTKKLEHSSRLMGYTDCLTSASKYKAFVDWFERLCRAEFDARDNPPALASIRAQLCAIRGAVDELLRPSGWHSIAFNSAEAGIVATHDQFGVLSVRHLSDGIRTLIALTADIAHRALRLNAHLGQEAVIATPGIVLIDEVDMHLHPEWQQVIMDSLCKAFPRIQFIVSTHSPQVLSSVHAESIRILQYGSDGWRVERPEWQTRGVESSDLLARIMAVDPVPLLAETRWLADYQALIENELADSTEAKGLREKLEAHFGSAHPVMYDCDRLIRFQAFKQRRANSGRD